MSPIQFSAIAELTDPAALERLVGPVAGVERGLIATSGYSGSTHERLDVVLRTGERRPLVLKHTWLARDWTAYRSGDERGREALLLAAPALLAALAAMHARYWNGVETELPWLVTPARLFGALGPRTGTDEGGPQWSLRDRVRDGWRAAMSRLPAAVAGLLRTPAPRIARRCEGLPRTLLHGDAKVANFALLPSGRVVALDWAWIGAGPATLDLGWYLAVNTSRLARSKEQVIERYRDLLESALGGSVPGGIWERMLSAGLLCGAVMLLWSKALALEAGSPRAKAEWDWWVERLSREVRF